MNVTPDCAAELFEAMDKLAAEIDAATKQLNALRAEEIEFRIGELAELMRRHSQELDATDVVKWKTNPRVLAAEKALNQADVAHQRLKNEVAAAEEALKALYARADLVKSAVSLQVALMAEHRTARLAEAVVVKPLAYYMSEESSELVEFTGPNAGD